MTKSVKTLLIVIGLLSTISGAYLAYSGSEFLEYFTGIFVGIVLLGAVIFNKKELE